MLAGQVELARLVDLCAQRLHLNMEYDASVLKGTVTLRLEGELSDEELWALTNRVLASRGFTTVRVTHADGGQSLSVVKIADASGVARVEGPPDAERLAAGFRSVVVRSKSRPAKDLAEALGKVLTKQGGGGSAATALDPGVGGLIVISDLSSRVDQALEILGRLDTPSAGTMVEEVPVEHVPPATLVALVTQLAAKRELISGERIPGEVLVAPGGASVLIVSAPERLESWRDLVLRLDRREPVETSTYTPHAFGAREVSRLIEQTVRDLAPGDDRWRLVIDELTGTLIVTATPSQHESIHALLQRLDATPPSARRPVRSFVIKNRSVTDLQEVLDRLVRSGVLAVPAENAPETPTAPNLQTTPRPFAPGGAADLNRPGPATSLPATNGLPPSSSGGGTTSSSDEAGRQGGQVLRAGSPRGERGGGAGTGGNSSPELSLTLTADEATNTLIAMGDPRVLEQLEVLIRQLDVRQHQVMLQVLMVSLTDGQTLDLGVELEKISLDADLMYRLSSLFGLSSRQGTGRAVGDAPGFTGVVLSPGDFSIVVRALQTLNHGRSLSMPRLLVGNNQQAVLDSVLQQPFSSVNASTTVSTTSFGGTQDAGTTLTIKPQIAEGDHLVLTYQVALSSFVGTSADPNLPPPRQQNKVQSVATIPDGHIVVVGGIELKSAAESVSQIPLLGDVPIVGELFKSRAKDGSESKFYVFIRADVLRSRSFEDLKYLSSRAAADVGVDDGFPEVKPQVIR